MGGGTGALSAGMVCVDDGIVFESWEIRCGGRGGQGMGATPRGEVG